MMIDTQTPQWLETAKQAVKKRQQAKNPLIRIGASVARGLWHAVRSTYSLCFDADFRAILVLRLFHAEQVHQTTSLTFMNRYPKLFAACRDYFAKQQNIKILSYGCSTGEEVLTLRQYFPNAHIVGAEINKHSLAVCRKQETDEKVTFIYSTPAELQKQGPYDVIFCMAVLQRTPQLIAAKGIRSLKTIYPFEKFEQQVIELDKLLKPQGLLVIHFSQYSLWDTAVAPKYQALSAGYRDERQAPIFDKDSNLVDNAPLPDSIFIKLRS